MTVTEKIKEEGRCACGCNAWLNRYSESVWFASEPCQRGYMSQFGAPLPESEQVATLGCVICGKLISPDRWTGHFADHTWWHRLRWACLTRPAWVWGLTGALSILCILIGLFV